MARPHLFRIAFHGLLDRWSKVAEAFDELWHPRRQSKHILKHQDLAVTGDAGADTDGGDRHLAGNAPGERLGDRLEHHGERAGVGDRTRIRLDRRPVALVATLGAKQPMR